MNGHLAVYCDTLHLRAFALELLKRAAGRPCHMLSLFTYVTRISSQPESGSRHTAGAQSPIRSGRCAQGYHQFRENKGRMTLRVGIVGCGGIAELHARGYRASKDVEIV